jgi:hypothetical protein
MHQGQLVFAQLMRHLPLTTFRRCVARYAGARRACIKSSCAREPIARSMPRAYIAGDSRWSG